LLRGDRFPIFCSGICPCSPQKNTPGSVNVPVQVGGLVINPGDIVVGDDDGVAVVPAGIAAEVARRAEDRMNMEHQQAEDIRNGKLPLEILFGPTWVDDVLKGKITEVDKAEESKK
jgi:4-hydroxy-4-methyl-2-oxoglutarate aldolase